MNACHASTMEDLLTSMDPSDPQFYTHLKAAADGDISYGTPSCTSEQVVDSRPSFSTILDHPRQCSNVHSLWPRPKRCRGGPRPGVRGFKSDLDKPAFAAIQGKDTGADRVGVQSNSRASRSRAITADDLASPRGPLPLFHCPS